MLPAGSSVDPQVCKGVRWREERQDQKCLDGRSEDQVMSLL